MPVNREQSSDGRRPPAALIALLGAALLLGIVWALVVPPFQAPDENAHVAYVQSLAENFELPGREGKESQSTEQRMGAEAANSDQTAQQPLTKPEWSEQAYDAWLSRTEALPDSARSDGGGPNPASPNPPLYYLYAQVPYELAAGDDFFARLTAMRVASLLFLLITVTATWLLAGTVFGPRRPLQLAAAAVPALLPMVSFVSGSVSPDSLTYALWTIALWLGARIVLERGGLPDAAGLLAVTGLAVTTKSTSYAIVPAVLFVLGLAVWRLRRRPSRMLAVAAVAVVAFAVAAGPWYAVARSLDRPAAAQLTESENPPDFDAREFGSYLWQYYLPRLPFMANYALLDPPTESFDTWLRHSWGAFGWLETDWPIAVQWVFAAITLVVVAAAVLALVRRRRRLNVALLAFFGLAGLSLLLGLHINEYRLAEVRGELVNQGRYLFPLIGVAGLVLAAAVSALPRAWRGAGLGVAVGGLATLQLWSLALVASRFYA